nr:putative disease resistance protein rga3 [Quercus suber]
MAEVIVSRVISFATELIGNAWGCEEELRGLGESLTMIRAVLTDAERRQVRDDYVKLWLRKLEDVAYEADDVLDEFIYENLRQKIEVENKRKRKVNFLDPFIFSLSMAKKIKAVQEKLAEVNGLANGLANGFGLARILSVDSNVEIVPTRETDSFLDHSEVVGRKSQISKIVSLLTSATNQQLAVIPIVGMAEGNHENDEEVLEGLKPHRYLKSLAIDDFGGKKFPSWMLTSLDAWDGILLFGNLIEIRFGNCRKCEVLPTLGLLPHLRVLTILGMDGVRRIGTEFYSNYNNGSDGTVLFPALRKLDLSRMPNLEEWADVMEPATTTGLTVFPCLEELSIQFCNQLKSAPCLFSSLKKLHIRDMCSTTFENIISKLTTLTSLEVWNISGLACLPEKLLQNNASLMSLTIGGWADLESIVSHEDVWAFCTSLRSLKIKVCWKLQIQGVPSHLQRLEINGCVILPTGLQSCTSLTLLEIQRCDKLKSIPNLGQLHSLTQLKIRYCDNLISIPDLRGLHSLIELQICHCPKLTSLPEGLESLTRLKTLAIGKFCKELDDFPSLVSIEHLHASLQHLELRGWPKLKSIPDNIQVFTALKSLFISHFEGMETWPEWLTKLSSLQILEIFRCSKLKECCAIGGKERKTWFLNFNQGLLMREQWQIDSSGEFDDSVRVIWNSSRNLHNFFFSLFEGCLTFPVAHKSNIMWVVTYAQVAGLSFSTSVNWNHYLYLQLLIGYIQFHHRQCINCRSSDFNTFQDSEKLKSPIRKNNLKLKFDAFFPEIKLWILDSMVSPQSLDAEGIHGVISYGSLLLNRIRGSSSTYRILCCYHGLIEPFVPVTSTFYWTSSLLFSSAFLS